MATKRMLGVSVLEAARQRIAWVFDNFPRIYLSFSGGKDSTVMLHLVMDEAIKRDRTIGVLFVDLSRRNWSDKKIGRELGMEPDEVLRLKQISGLAELFTDQEFSEAWEIGPASKEGVS